MSSKKDNAQSRLDALLSQREGILSELVELRAELEGLELPDDLDAAAASMSGLQGRIDAGDRLLEQIGVRIEKARQDLDAAIAEETAAHVEVLRTHHGELLEKMDEQIADLLETLSGIDATSSEINGLRQRPWHPAWAELIGALRQAQSTRDSYKRAIAKAERGELT